MSDTPQDIIEAYMEYESGARLIKNGHSMAKALIAKLKENGYVIERDWQTIEDKNSGDVCSLLMENRETGKRIVACEVMRNELFWDNKWRPIKYKHLPTAPNKEDE